MNNPDGDDLGNIRADELAKLDQLLEQFFTSACAGDYRASELYLQALKRKAEFLGLDAPSESRVEVVTYDQIELQRQYEFFTRRTDSQRQMLMDDGTSSS